MERRLELLAPAGSFESLKAAVHAGADAVYMGGSRFGARAYAENPKGEQLLAAVDYAHLYGAKLYLTINTLLKEQELTRELYDYLLPCYEHGLDAVIVQDLGVLRAVREWFPDLPVHASTQMTLCGAGGAQLLEEEGFRGSCWQGSCLLKRLPGSMRTRKPRSSASCMERSATAIPDSACSAVFWAGAAATAAAAPSLAGFPMRRWQRAGRSLREERRHS